jgi:hypothetical protein
MTALTLLRDGAATAAQLLALLFAVPAAAAPPTPATPATVARVEPGTAASLPPALLVARDLHLASSAFDVRLLGSLVDVRIVQAVHNTGPRPIDLGARLPATDTHVERLRVERAGHAVDLVAGDFDGCGGDDTEPHDGHAQAALDEVLADVLSLPAGQQATIEVVAVDFLERQAGAWRLALPATILPLTAQAVLIHPAEGPVLIVVPPAGSQGEATLTLRPDGAAAQVIALGRAEGAAFAVPLADAAAVAQLADGAVEIEVVQGAQRLWTSLPPSVRRADTGVIARHSR